jgi:hypothetical protein
MAEAPSARSADIVAFVWLVLKASLLVTIPVGVFVGLLMWFVQG